MVKTIIIFLLSIFVIQCSLLNAQDEFLLLNGKTKYGKLKEIKDDIIFYNYFVKDKIKSRYFSMLDVYSIKKENGEEEVFYKKDTALGFYLTIEEMKRYIDGAQLAQDRYRSPYAAPLGVIAGSGGVYMAVYGFNIPPTYALAVPVGYVIFASILYPHPKAKKYFPRERHKDYLYKAGFNDVARRKKAMSAIRGSLIGLGIFGVYTVATSIK